VGWVERRRKPGAKLRAAVYNYKSLRKKAAIKNNGVEFPSWLSG